MLTQFFLHRPGFWRMLYDLFLLLSLFLGSNNFAAKSCCTDKRTAANAREFTRISENTFLVMSGCKAAYTVPAENDTHLNLSALHTHTRAPISLEGGGFLRLLWNLLKRGLTIWWCSRAGQMVLTA